MDIHTLLYTFLIIQLSFLIRKFITRQRRRTPPTPAAALPLIGHLHLLKKPLHRSFHRLSQIAGPVFSLKLGVRFCVVVSSPDLAEECFTKLDKVLANRPKILTGKYFGYNHQNIVASPYGDHWRNLRRIVSTEILSTARLNDFLHIRRDEVNRLLRSLLEASDGAFKRVELRPKLSELALNNIMRMIAGRRYFNEVEESEQAHGFPKLIHEVFEIAEGSDPQIFLPFLQWIDFRGFTKKLTSLANQTDQYVQSLIDEHRMQKKDTMIGHLLSLQESQPEFYSDQIIKALIMDMLIAGTDTNVVSIEWAMSNLVNNPHVLETARAELDDIVGQERLMNEEDLPNLPYLRSLILESSRLFPAGPLLIAHASSEDCRLGAYDIPRGTMVMVNAWAIHRDPEVWEDAAVFKPERFVGKRVEPRHFMPFGMGRRACPGSALGLRMVGLALGSLIQCFEWERVSLEKVDMTEGVGLSMPKLIPLKVICKPRHLMKNLILQEPTRC